MTPLGPATSWYVNDANDNLSQLRYPSGRVVTYHYDAENRLTSFDHRPAGAPADVPFATGFTYGTDGRLQSYVTGAVTHNFTYEAGRPKRLWTTGGAAALDLTYAYDDVGNVASITDPRPNASQAFVPDPLDRLTSASGPWGTLTWSYDNAGNRLSETASGVLTSYTYDASTQRLTSTSGGVNESFGYDNVGRVTSDGLGAYTYSALGRLTAFNGTGVSATYTYDTAGERFSKTVNGQTTYSARSLSGQTLSEFVSSCGAIVWSRDLLYAGGQLIGSAKAVTTQPSVAMSSTTTSVNENTGSVTLSVRLTTPNGAALGCPVTVSYATSAGTATAGGDYTQTSGNVTFASGAANGSTQSFTVPIVNDGVNEASETFSAAVTGASGATVGIPATSVVTILDDDPPPVSFSASATSVPENGGTAQVSIVLATAAPIQAAVTVHYATADGTAVAGADYTATSGTATFPALSTTGATQVVQVPIVNDGLHESNETFTVTLSSPAGAQLASPSTVTVTIVEDDPVPQPHVTLDVPADGATTPSTVAVAGWAIDGAAPSGTGIDSVQLVAYPNADPSQTPIVLGTASYGGWRSDIAAAYGSAFGPSAFSLSATLPGPGVYLLRANAHDPLSGNWEPSNARTITVQATPRMAVDTPHDGTVAGTFAIAGWAIDAGAGSGTGVSAVHVWAYPNPGSGQDPVWVGAASLGASRPDVGAVYGSQFTPSGFGLTASLPAGYYQVVVYALSTVTGTFNQSQSVYVTVNTGIALSFDTPAENASVGQPFVLAGWAVDTSVASGNGVPFVHIWASPQNGNPAIFIGAANTGGSRPDIAAWLQDNRFAASAWAQSVSGLAPGWYYIAVYPYSSATGFGAPVGRWIQVQ
jgi:YD repeat-containing protein